MPTVAKTLGRAMLINSAFQNVGLITKEYQSKVVDKSKLHRERVGFHRKLNKENTASTAIRGLYFDGRKDDTDYQEKIGSKYYREKEKKEHITLLEEPQSKFFGHTVPQKGDSKSVTKSIFDYLNEKEVDLSNLGIISDFLQ